MDYSSSYNDLPNSFFDEEDEEVDDKYVIPAEKSPGNQYPLPLKEIDA